jgi:hypothetical protein
MTYFAKVYQQNKFQSDTKPEKVEKEKKVYKFKKKPTGELELFHIIEEERGLKSQITGEEIGEFNVWCFAHILPKAQNKYPLFKLIKENIIVMTYDQHFAWDNRRESLKGKSEWAWVFDLEAELKEAYELLK